MNQKTLFRFIKGEHLEIRYQDLQVQETWWSAPNAFLKHRSNFIPDG